MNRAILLILLISGHLAHANLECGRIGSIATDKTEGRHVVTVDMPNGGVQGISFYLGKSEPARSRKRDEYALELAKTAISNPHLQFCFDFDTETYKVMRGL